MDVFGLEKEMFRGRAAQKKLLITRCRGLVIVLDPVIAELIKKIKMENPCISVPAQEKHVGI